MDVREACGKVGSGAKTGVRFSAEKINQATAAVGRGLDVAAPAVAPFAARWDAEADRRAKLRTPEHLKALIVAQRENTSARSTAATAKAQRRAAKAASSNPLNGARRAARTADKAASGHAKSTRADLKAARKNYPQTLTRLAVKLHALHAIPAAAATYVMSDAGDWTTWPVGTSLGLIALNAGAVLVGRRQLTVQLDEEMSAEERALIGRLDPLYWAQHAEARGLAGTVTGVPALGNGGITCRVRLDGQWTVKKFRAAEDNVRNLLGMRTATRMRITNDREGGWAVISIATRSAAAGRSSAWTPELIPADRLMMSLGLDTETGEEVLIPFDERMLIAGASGTGKSWSTRPLLATAHLRGDLVLIDGKGEEANEWDGVCRCAVEMDEIDAVVDEIHGEMNRRKADMKRRKISVWDGDQLTVLVDEGQVVLASIGKDKDRLQRLIELSSLGRSRGIVLWWATQKPVMSGGAPGVHNLIAPNLLTRFCLRVADQQEAQTALDDCADYQPQKIERGKEWRGHGYLKDYGPRMIRTWTLDNAGIRALPAKIWRGTAAPAATDVPAVSAAPGERPALRLVKGDDFLLAPPAPRPAAEAPAESATEAGPVTNRDKVLGAVRDGARTARDITDRTGLNKGTVSRELKQLLAAGAVRKGDDGMLTAGEVSA
ncbi:MarR family transcriptional regulator [Streptomyces sp. NPDC020480]|uniref:MarR family transcriptional regulator n=1 Tax=Streptomyces sp. NPDC020480 TaxID=3365076 RepID=UPI00379446C4